MYIANHYVRCNGRMYMKGEAIPDISADKIEWLLSSGAISSVDEIQTAVEENTEIPDEIDVMAGIITDAPKEAEKPKKSNAGRKKKS